MRTDHLRYLLEVAHSKSISEASQKLFIGQRTLSAIINSIEAELNIKLFQRSYQGIKLTPQGEQAMALIEEMVSRDSMLHDLAFNNHQSQQILHFVSYPSACCALSSVLTRTMRECSPNTTLIFHEQPYSKIIPFVASGKARIAIGAETTEFVFSRQCEAQEASLYFEKVYQDSFCLAVSSNSPYAKRESVSLSELYHEHFATSQYYPLMVGTPISKVFKNFANFTVFANSDSIKQAVAQGSMISLIPRLSFYDDIYVETGRICLITLDDFPERLINFLIYPGKDIDPAEQALLDELHRFFQKLD